MKKRIMTDTVLILTAMFLCACGSDPSGETEIAFSEESFEEAFMESLAAQEAEDAVKPPYDIETYDGTLRFSDIWILQNETAHGYDGYVLIGLEYVDMDEDDRYWWNKDWSISITDGTQGGSQKLDLKDVRLSKIGTVNGIDYYGTKINEVRLPFDELKFSCRITLHNGLNASGRNRVDVDIYGSPSLYNLVTDISEIPDDLRELIP